MKFKTYDNSLNSRKISLKDAFIQMSRKNINVKLIHTKYIKSK